MNYNYIPILEIKYAKTPTVQHNNKLTNKISIKVSPLLPIKNSVAIAQYKLTI